MSFNGRRVSTSGSTSYDLGSGSDESTRSRSVSPPAAAVPAEVARADEARRDLARRAVSDVALEPSRKRRCRSDRTASTAHFFHPEEVAALSADELAGLSLRTFSQFSPEHYQAIRADSLPGLPVSALLVAPSNWINEKFSFFTAAQRFSLYEFQAISLDLETVLSLPWDTFLWDLSESSFLLNRYSAKEWVAKLPLFRAVKVLLVVMYPFHNEYGAFALAWIAEVIQKYQLPVYPTGDLETLFFGVLNCLLSGKELEEIITLYETVALGNTFPGYLRCIEAWVDMKLEYPDGFQESPPDPIHLALLAKYGGERSYQKLCQCLPYLSSKAAAYLFALADDKERLAAFLTGVSRLELPFEGDDGSISGVDVASEFGKACTRFSSDYALDQAFEIPGFPDLSSELDTHARAINHDMKRYGRLCKRVERRLAALEKQRRLGPAIYERLQAIKQDVAEVKRLWVELPARRRSYTRVNHFLNAAKLRYADHPDASDEDIKSLSYDVAGRIRVLEMKWCREHEPERFVREKWHYTHLTALDGDHRGATDRAYEQLEAVLQVIKEEIGDEIDPELDYDLLIRAEVHKLPCGEDRSWSLSDVEAKVEAREAREVGAKEALCSALKTGTVTIDDLEAIGLSDQMSLLLDLLYGDVVLADMEERLGHDGSKINSLCQILDTIRAAI